MDVLDYSKYLAALAFVLGLIALLGFIARRYHLFRGPSGPVSRGGRLGLIDTLSIDQKRKLILVRRDDHEHLLLLAPTGDRVIETEICEEPYDDPRGGIHKDLPDGDIDRTRIVSLTRYHR